MSGVEDWRGARIGLITKTYLQNIQKMTPGEPGDSLNRLNFGMPHFQMTIRLTDDGQTPLAIQKPVSFLRCANLTTGPSQQGASSCCSSVAAAMESSL